MTKQENAAIVRRSWEELFNNGDLAAADELIAADFKSHAAPGAHPGPASFK